MTVMKHVFVCARKYSAAIHWHFNVVVFKYIRIIFITLPMQKQTHSLHFKMPTACQRKKNES